MSDDERNARRFWAYKLKSKYGITADQFDTMLAEQCGRCAVCGTDDYGKRGKLFVDHCHTTQTVRGLLCHNCNSALGLFKDSTASLTRAVEYLKCHEAIT